MPTLNKIKLLIFLAVWKRPTITELCFLGIERLKAHPDYDISVLAVISEPEMIPLCEKYGVVWTMYKNEPLGEKKNHGLSVAKDMDFEYLMEIGSDDLILNALLDDYKRHIEKKDYFFGITDAAYIESNTGLCRRLISRHSTYGAGRMIHRRVLKDMGWKLWADKLTCGMDNNSIFNVAKKGYNYVKVPHGEMPYVIDVKSDVNLWRFNYFLGEEYEKLFLYEKLSGAEIKLLDSHVVAG